MKRKSLSKSWKRFIKFIKPYLNTRKKKVTAFIAFLLILSFLFIFWPSSLTRYGLPWRANRSAELFFEIPSQEKIAMNQDFVVELHVKSNQSAINAVSARINFDPRIATISAFTTESSFCTLYTENRYDNINGQIRIGCGTPNPGFQGDSLIFKATFRSKQHGNLNLDFDMKNTMALANDGKGTDILRPPASTAIVINQTY